MAVTRGVESGLFVARAARAGALTVSDPRGRILAEARTGDAEFVSVTAGLPSRAEPTLYASFGDWFPRACVLLLLLAGAAAALRRVATATKGTRRRSGNHATGGPHARTGHSRTTRRRPS